jgi:hypothetical protein
MLLAARSRRHGGATFLGRSGPHRELDLSPDLTRSALLPVRSGSVGGIRRHRRFPRSRVLVPDALADEHNRLVRDEPG